MTLRLLTLVAGTFAASMLLAAVVRAAPEMSTIPLSFTTDASCPGESIAFTGMLRLVRDDADNGNRLHRHGHFTVHLDGTGLSSGAKYIGTGSGSVNVNVSAPPSHSGTSTLVSNLHIIRVGESAPADDYNEHIVIRLTITATGEEVAYADDYRGGCG
jgi:hypothetical protein